MKCSRYALACGALAICFGACAEGNAWYVAKEDPNASDAPCECRGTETLPYRTIQAALDAVSFESGDTVYVKPGVYDEGGAVDSTNGMTNRVYITKKVHLKATSTDRSDTVILGRHADPAVATHDIGMGPGAVRCVCVNGAAGTVIEGFTLKDGATSHSDGANPNYNKGGCFLVYSDKKDVYLVDSALVNGAARHGGGMRGGTAIRCLFDGCGASTGGGTTDGACVFSCVYTRCRLNYAIGNTSDYVVNCTLFGNKAGCVPKSANAHVYNCIFAGNGGTEVSGTAATVVDCTRNATATKYQVFSPYFGDYRPLAGSAPIDFASATNRQVLVDQGVPTTYLAYDYLKDEIDWNLASGKVNAGAIQTPATPACARVEFPEATEVDGMRFDAGSWFHSETYPVQYLVKPVVADGSTFYCYEPTSGSYVYPQTNGEMRVTPPPTSVTTVQTYTQKLAASVIWAEPSLDGNDLDQGDGAEATPYKTLQAAMDAVTTSYTVIYAKPGDYKYGGAEVYGVTNRVKFVADKYVSVRPAPNADGAVVICGAADPTTANGCGTGAVRCVYGSRCGSLLNVTLAGGRTRADARTAAPNGNDDAQQHGAAMYQNDSNGRFVIVDSTVTNCVGTMSLLHRGTLLRCRVVDCEAAKAVNKSMVAVSLMTGNRFGCYPNNGSTLFQSTFSGNVKMTGESEFVAWYNQDSVYNCVMVDPITAIRSKSDPLTAVGNWVWGNTGGTDSLTAYCTHADPKLADGANGDYRLSNLSPAIGHGMAPAQMWASYYSYAGSDLNYGPMLAAADGTLTPGCYQTGLPAVLELPAGQGLVYRDAQDREVSGKVVAEPDVPGVPLTVCGDQTASRWTPGFVLNGVTNLFTAWPGSVSVAVAYSTATQKLVALPKSTQWYANVTNTSGVANGFTPATGKTTLAGVFGDCAVEAGDTVNVLPGTYAEGKMRQSESAAVWARAVVPTDVTLRATSENVADTVVVGDSVPDGNIDEGQGCGTNAVRCLYLASNARAEGLTLTGGRVLGKNLDKVTKDVDIYGGGVRAADTTAVVRDCIISNCVAYRGGAAYSGTLVGCRILENDSVNGNMTVGGARLYYCLVDRNHCSGLMYCEETVGCTVGPENRTRGGERCWDTWGPRATVANSLVYAPGASDYYVNCAFAKDIPNRCGVTEATKGPGSILTNVAALAIDANYRPVKGNPVIDAGSSAWLTAYLPATDLGGVPRVLNAGRIDIGAMEYDWRVDYGRLLGRGVKVTDVTSNVTAVVGGVAVPAGGTLAATWTRSDRPNRAFVADLSAAGTSLSMTVDGETSVIEGAGVRTVEVLELPDETSLSFSCQGDGEAVLRNFRSLSGMMLLVH